MDIAAADFIDGRIESADGAYPQFGANFNTRFSSREAAQNAKEKGCDGFFVPALEEVSSATEFRLLRVFRVFRGFA